MTFKFILMWIHLNSVESWRRDTECTLIDRTMFLSITKLLWERVQYFDFTSSIWKFKIINLETKIILFASGVIFYHLLFIHKHVLHNLNKKHICMMVWRKHVYNFILKGNTDFKYKHQYQRSQTQIYHCNWFYGV